MDKEELRERYEASGDERFYEQAKLLYEQAMENSPGDPVLLTDYGFLRESHGRAAIRAAAGCYERAIGASPGLDKAHWQLIGALAALRDLDTVRWRYERQIAAAPGDIRGYRFLSAACLRAGDYEKAATTISAGLTIAPEDPGLTELQGDLHAATGHPGDALASWRRAFALATDDDGISMRFSAAFLLERQGQPAEAAGEWRFIIGWMEQHGDAIHLDWPRQELRRLEALQEGLAPQQ
jgi:tetratricopeptide (TPR) repeat protein